MNGYNSPGNYKGNTNLHREQGHEIFRNVSWNRYVSGCFSMCGELPQKVLANKPAPFEEHFHFLMITY